MRAAIVFVGLEIAAFVLWAVHILPDFGVACLVIGGCFTGLAIGNHRPARKVPVSIESSRRSIPSGLGTDVPISNSGTMIDNTIVFGDYRSGPIAQAALMDWATITGKISEPPYGGQSNSAFLALVKAIDQELNARIERAGEAEKSDDRYEEPQASYPMEMKIHEH